MHTKKQVKGKKKKSRDKAIKRTRQRYDINVKTIRQLILNN